MVGLWTQTENMKHNFVLVQIPFWKTLLNQLPDLAQKSSNEQLGHFNTNYNSVQFACFVSGLNVPCHI